MAQTNVYVKTAPALPGQLEMGNEDGFSAVAYRADVALTVGRFIMAKSGDATKAVQSGATAVLGILPFLRQHAAQGVAASMAVPAGQRVVPFILGAIAIKNESGSTASVGMNVFASQTDGKALFSSNATLSSATPTAFKVVKVFDAGADGTMVIIDNRGASAPVAPADLSAYLKSADAATTYLTKTQADELYEPKTP